MKNALTSTAAILFFALFFTVGCGRPPKRLQASVQNSGITYSLLRAATVARQADGTIAVDYAVEAAGSPSFRFTPTAAAPLVFPESGTYRKTYPATQTEITETGVLEAMDSGGNMLSIITLKAGPFFADNSGTPPPSAICATVNMEPSPPLIPVSAAGVVLGDGIALVKIATTENATLAEIKEKTMPNAGIFRVISTGQKEHVAEIRYRMAGKSDLSFGFDRAGVARTSCTASTVVIAVTTPPQCQITVNPNRIIVASGAQGTAEVKIAVNGFVSDAYIGNTKLLPGQTTASFNFPIGNHMVQGRVIGPTGESVCTAALEVIDGTPRCELVVSDSSVFPGTKVTVTLIHTNANTSPPVTVSDIDGYSVKPQGSITEKVWTDTRFRANVKNALGQSSCAVTVNTGF